MDITTKSLNRKGLQIMQNYGMNSWGYLKTIKGIDYFILGYVVGDEPQPTGLPIVVFVDGEDAGVIDTERAFQILKSIHKE